MERHAKVLLSIVASSAALPASGCFTMATSSRSTTVAPSYIVVPVGPPAIPVLEDSNGQPFVASASFKKLVAVPGAVHRTPSIAHAMADQPLVPVGGGFSIDPNLTVGSILLPGRAFDLNENGEVAGWVANPTPAPQAIRWPYETVELTPGLSTAATPFPLEEGAWSKAYGINAAGHLVGVVGKSEALAALINVYATQGFKAFFWDGEDVITFPTEGAPGHNFIPRALNGVLAVGSSYANTAEGNPGSHLPFLYSTFTETWGHLPLAQGVVSGHAKDVNSGGVIVGNVVTDDPDRPIQACRWRKEATPPSPGVGLLQPSVVDGYVLELLTDSSKSHMDIANAINSSGVIVGSMPIGSRRAAIWSPETEEVLLLPYVPGAQFASMALGLNDSGAVVGYSVVSGENRATLWLGSTAYDLNALIPPNSEWTLVRALAINETGEIIANAILHGAYRDVLLRPAP